MYVHLRVLNLQTPDFEVTELKPQQWKYTGGTRNRVGDSYLTRNQGDRIDIRSRRTTGTPGPYTDQGTPVRERKDRRPVGETRLISFTTRTPYV